MKKLLTVLLALACMTMLLCGTVAMTALAENEEPDGAVVLAADADTPVANDGAAATNDVAAAADGAEAASNGTEASAETSGEAAPQNGNSLMTWLYYGGMILIIVVLYMVMIRPQRKKQKEEQKMRNNLRVGDELTTIGGICGRVLTIKDDTIVIETGVDRNKMTLKKWAIQSVDTVHDTPADDDDDDDDI